MMAVPWGSRLGAPGRPYILEVDTAESRTESLYDINEFSGILLINLNVETVDSREYFEQESLPLQHRFPGLGTYVAETQHGGAVGYHSHEVSAVGIVIDLAGVILDFETGIRHAGRICER